MANDAPASKDLAEAAEVSIAPADRKLEKGLVRIGGDWFLAIADETIGSRTCYVRLEGRQTVERRIIDIRSAQASSAEAADAAQTDTFYAETPSGIEHHTVTRHGGTVTETIDMSRESRTITEAAAGLDFGQDKSPNKGEYHSVVLHGERTGSSRSLKVEVAQGKLSTTLTESHQAQLLVTEPEYWCSVESESADPDQLIIQQRNGAGEPVSIAIDMASKRWTLLKHRGDSGKAVLSASLQEWVNDDGTRYQAKATAETFSAGDLMIRNVAAGKEITVHTAASGGPTASPWIRFVIGLDDSVRVEIPGQIDQRTTGPWAREKPLRPNAIPLNDTEGVQVILEGRLGWPAERVTALETMEVPPPGV